MGEADSYFQQGVDAQRRRVRECQHPGDQVVADILQADSRDHKVQWCRICGAYRVVLVRLQIKPGDTAATWCDQVLEWERPLGRALAPLGDKVFK